MCWIRYGRSLRQNEMKKDKNIILDNFIWRFAERCGAQLVTAVVTLLLARILMPEDYGRTALVAVFINILQVFIDSGLGTALIQRKDADDLDFSSVFYFNFAVCLVLYAGMFIAAPYIAAFYKDPSLTPVVRVASLTLVFSGVKGIQQAYVSRNMMFKRFFFATLGGTLFSAFLGLGMAYAGFGVWALVAQQLSNTAIDTLILWLTVHWRPKAVFSWQRLKGLLSYGWRLLASSLLDTVYNNLRSLVIGRVYTSADLAFYNEGMLAPDVIAVNVDSSIDSVLLPAMSAGAGRACTGEKHDPPCHQDLRLRHCAADDGDVLLRRAARPAGADREMAALCTVSADFLHHLHVLSDPHGKPECDQGNGPQRSVSEVGDHQEDHGLDPAPADLPHQRDGNGLQPDPEQPAEPVHQYMAEQKTAGLPLSGTAERHPAQHSAGYFHGLLHVAGQSCTSAGHRNVGHSDPDRCSGVSGRFCTAEAGYV